MESIDELNCVDVAVMRSVTSVIIVPSLLRNLFKANLCASLFIITYSLARVPQTCAAHPLARRGDQLGGLATCRHSTMYAKDAADNWDTCGGWIMVKYQRTLYGALVPTLRTSARET